MVNSSIIDADSKGMYLLIVLIVSCAVIVGKFAFFNVQYYYIIKRMIFSVVRCLADQAYGGCSLIEKPNAPDNCNCKSDVSPAVNDDALATEVEKDYDSYIVNLSKYLESNADSNRRLDVLNSESSGYVEFYNWLEVLKFFIIIAFVTGAILMIVRLKYRVWLSPLGLITGSSVKAAV